MYNTTLFIINSTKPMHCTDTRENSAYYKKMTRKLFKPIGSLCRSPVGAY